MIENIERSKLLELASKEVSPSLMDALLVSPHSPEKLIIFAMRFFLPCGMMYENIRGQLDRDAIIATGREAISVNFSLDLLRQCRDFVHIVEDSLRKIEGEEISH